MVDDVFDFFDQAVLEQPHAYPTGAQGSHFRPQAFGTVVADHGNFVSIFESKAEEAQCEVFNVLKIIVPCDGAPDSKLFLTHGHPVFAILVCLFVKKFGDRQIFCNFNFVFAFMLNGVISLLHTGPLHQGMP